MTGKVNVTREMIVADLKALGVEPGHQLLVHSSLSSLGHVEGGAATVVAALLEALGPTGTVLFPTLTGTEEDSPDRDLNFSVSESACWTGAIPEAGRRRPDAIRSAHPTHSVCAIGANARWFASGHELCITPCGEGSPYAKLAAEPKGMILLLGCDHESNTTMHHIEELAGAAYHLKPRPARGVIQFADRVEVRHYWIHDWGTPRRFNALEPLLEERGLQLTGTVCTTTARLIPAGPFVQLGVEVLRADPTFFMANATRP